MDREVISISPDSEVDDTLGHLDNMRFSESEEEESEDESERDCEEDDSEDESKSGCDDSTLIEGVHEQDLQLMIPRATPLTKSPFLQSLIGNHSPSQSTSSSESEPTVPFIALDIMDGMTSLIENSISSLPWLEVTASTYPGIRFRVQQIVSQALHL